MLFALAATSALVALLLAIIYAAGVHALAILAGLAAFAGLAALSVPIGPSILVAALVTIGTSVASRHAITSTHRELRFMARAAVAACAGYAGFAMAGDIAVFAGLGSVARIAIALCAGAALAAASIWRISPWGIGSRPLTAPGIREASRITSRSPQAFRAGRNIAAGPGAFGVACRAISGRRAAP